MLKLNLHWLAKHKVYKACIVFCLLLVFIINTSFSYLNNHDNNHKNFKNTSLTSEPGLNYLNGHVFFDSDDFHYVDDDGDDNKKKKKEKRKKHKKRKKDKDKDDKNKEQDKKPGGNDSIDVVLNDTVNYIPVIIDDSTKSTITLPSNFKQADDFNGYMHKGSGTTFIFKSYNGYSYTLYHNAFVKQTDFFAKQNLQFEKVDTIEYNTMKGYLYYFSFSPKEDIVFKRKVLVTGSYNNTILVMVNYPALIEEEITDVIRKAIESINLN